ncbi:MAG TPA: histone deacetylase family protein [Candidatus Limnocylindria bacterium]|nr:histone deacetylase family protein [Candidatus Limnocylindria bacterium]
MSLRTTMVWSDDVLLHVPSAEIWVGVRTPGTEVAERATLIREACLAAGAPELGPMRHDDEVLAALHDPGLLNHLEHVYDDWTTSGIPDEVGQDRVVPYVFPLPGLVGSLPVREPTAVHGRAGRWCYDTMTLVGPGTWTAARAAIDVAQTAADLVASGATRSAYALCRPPGHHVSREGFGGSCYLNNAAVAAETLRRAGHGRVAVVDVDAHHGNGTQAIFYERADVLYASLHVDPGAGWFPHYVGFADETGGGDGRGATLNLPLAPGSGDEVWLAAIDQLGAAVADRGATALVVSLGVDAALHDPESPLRVSTEGYARAGDRLAALGLPTVHVQEGGYHLPTLGELVVAFLEPFPADQLGGDA